MPGNHIEGGFQAPVFEAQSVFRSIMNAMAQPGASCAIASVPKPPAPLSPVAAAIALTMCDHDTPIWLDPPLLGCEAVVAWLGFHCGAPLAHAPCDAHFALVADAASLIAIDNFAPGSHDYPDRSTTLVLQVESLEGGDGLRLEGPGIETGAHLAPTPMPRHIVEQWRQNNMRFPRGVDLILAGPGALACLSRTTRISPREN